MNQTSNNNKQSLAKEISLLSVAQCKIQVQRKHHQLRTTLQSCYRAWCSASICLLNCMMLAWDNPEEQNHHATFTCVSKHDIVLHKICLKLYYLIFHNCNFNCHILLPIDVVGSLRRFTMIFSFFYNWFYRLLLLLHFF